jgi:hypothetical protein
MIKIHINIRNLCITNQKHIRRQINHLTQSNQDKTIDMIET